MSKLTDRLKHMVVEDEPAPQNPAPQASATKAAAPSPAAPVFQPVMPSAAATTASASAFASPYGAPAVQVDENVYKRVLAKTDFEATDTAAVIHKYLDAMADLPLDANTKFKTAIAQAKKLEGLTEERILATFDGLKVALQHEVEVFQQNADNFVKNEVTARQDKLAQIQQQIADLQAQQTQLAQDFAEAQSKATNAQTQFNLAAQRRATEIDQQKAQFATMLH
jgi:hypothetical protein